jgi:choline dehydrogenase-like flavoprotein
MAIADPVRQGLARGWRVIDASTLAHDVEQECDVAIVGTGAGGGTAAEILAEAGLSVVLIEEGPLRSSSDFHMREREAYPELYQESAARKTGDKAINILQGRCVGGGTTVNWTSAFRTPAATLARWRSHHGVRGFDEASLAPWLARMEARLGVAPWTVAPNANNAALARAADALRVSHAPERLSRRGRLAGKRTRADDRSDRRDDPVDPLLTLERCDRRIRRIAITPYDPCAAGSERGPADDAGPDELAAVHRRGSRGRPRLIGAAGGSACRSACRKAG